MPTTLHPFAFGDPDSGNVPLKQAPLLRTIAQVRFPHLTRFTTNEDAVAHSIAEALADQYPLMSVGNETIVTITAEGVGETPSTTRLWRLASGDRSWQVTFCGTFLSIDTSNYESRSDFARRLSEAWTALNQQIAVPYIERLGIRYLNQLTEREHLNRLPEFVRPEVLGVAMAQDAEVVLASSLTETRYQFADNTSFLARWGLLPAGASIENSGPSYDYPTWVLDMDSFCEYAAGARGGEAIYENVRDLALRAYQFFRWTLPDESLDAFGGER